MIDVSTFAAQLPAGTYAVGDIVQLKNTAGPAVVRSGRGAAVLKRISSFLLTGTSGSTAASWRVHVKNSDWVDDVVNFAIQMESPTAMDFRSGAIQPGHDCGLTQNSSWSVWAECVGSGTTTIANTVTAEIEVDYPQVSTIIDPTTLPGVPCSIEHEATSVTINATSAGETATWQTYNVDIFKAGFEYALEKIELVTSGVVSTGYVAIENAAGMGGLQRIIPICTDKSCVKPPITYASKLVKGPMDIKYKLFNTAGTATTADVKLIMDFVKRRV